MRLAPGTWLYVFDSAQVTLCKLVRELRAEEPFAMLSGKTERFLKEVAGPPSVKMACELFGGGRVAL